MTPKVDSATSKLASGERQRLGVGFAELDRQPLRSGARTPLFQQRGHIVGGGDLRKAACRGERGVAVAGSDIDNPFVGADVGGLGERFADDLERDADDGKIAARPSRLLALLDRGEIGRARIARWLG